MMVLNTNDPAASRSNCGDATRVEAHPPTAVATRRGRHLQPVQTTLSPTSSPRSPRSPLPPKSPGNRPAPPRPEEVASSPTGERIPLRAPKSQSSKSSLRNLFLRSKSSRSSIPSSDNNVPLSAIGESHPLAVSSPRSLQAPSPAPTCGTPVSIAPSRNTPTPQQDLRTASSTASKPPRDKSSLVASSWHPPPLFKAYPQALKEATLPTPNLPPETILEIDGQRRVTNARKAEEKSEAHDSGTGPNETPKKKKKGGKIQKRSRRLSATINKAEWTQKIYMMATGGRVLQYNIDGDYDRQPEKIMELGPNSVAFASDVLPGKHWVLQISQTVESKSTVTFDTRRTFFSRLGLPEARKWTKTMLLVFEQPEELASWLALVRREIELLGGKGSIPEAPSEGSTPDLHRIQSLRVNKKPDKSEQPRTPLQQEHTPTDVPAKRSVAPNSNVSEKSAPRSKHVDRASGKQTEQRSVPRRPSIEAPSLSTLGTPTDLDRLRNTSRLSYVSAGTRTMPSSGTSSPVFSTPAPKSVPVNSNADGDSHLDSTRSDRSTTVPFAESRNNKREPIVQKSSPPAQDESRSQNPVTSRPPSSVGSMASKGKSRATPNFSVPSFSKRYSVAIPSRGSSQHNSTAPSTPQSASSIATKADSLQSITYPNIPIESEMQPSEDNRIAPSTPRSTSSTATKTNSLRSVTYPNPSTDTGIQRDPKPRRSKSSRRKASSRNEEKPTSGSLASCSEVSEVQDPRSATPKPQKPTQSTNPKYSSREGNFRLGHSISEAMPELPQPRHDDSLRNRNSGDIGVEKRSELRQRSKTKGEPPLRPFSMHVASSRRDFGREMSFEDRRRDSSSPTLNNRTLSPPRSTPRTFNDQQEDSDYSGTSSRSTQPLSKRRSMPVISHLPPPAPPPNCPLPEIPRHISSDLSGPWDDRDSNHTPSPPLQRKTRRSENRLSRGELKEQFEFDASSFPSPPSSSHIQYTIPAPGLREYGSSSEMRSPQTNAPFTLDLNDILGKKHGTLNGF